MFNKLKDKRVDCLSIMVEMKIGDYLQLVEDAYKNAGGIEGQRSPLKTKTGITIRKRLVADIEAGAIIPPVVVGVLLKKEKYESFENITDINKYINAANEEGGNRISVIDGMQRTTAMLTAINNNPEVKDHLIRVEFWVAEQVNSLIYRMLILNTGQVPWEIGRQLETIYGQFITQIKEKSGDIIDVFQTDDNRRRVQAGQYQSKNIIELLLVFSSRKSEIDIKDKVAEDFARLDAIETTAHNEFIEYFISTMRAMSKLDVQFGRINDFGLQSSRLKSGKDIFGSFPAMVGFFSAVSIELFDEPGFQIQWELASQKMAEVEKSVETIVKKMSALDTEELLQFIQADLLEERLSQRSGQVGRFERELFRKSFQSMLRNSARLTNLEPCWRA